MWLALETSGDLASAAVGTSGRLIAQASITEPRHQASELPGLIDQVLRMAGATESEIEGIIIGDGPGGFTGLRIGATVVKALVRARRRPLWTIASLRALAAARAGSRGRTVVALGDALRGEVYATAVRGHAAGLETVVPARVWRAGELAAQLPAPDLVVIRPEGRNLLPSAWAGIETEIASPSAAELLDLIGRAAGARHIPDPEGWEPEYGRPAEAQAKWEATHGRRLPDSPGQLS
ncbi:MAG: tRNA (adenosine(37)-N6)-threonylcarbamoyltransferase complex dimerization subunit type 1 TsaB [Gemmatimonadota bacterium]